MTLPGLRDWIFSLKTFASGMLALWIAFSLGLDRPYWAMATAYMVSQPLTGAMRSKGVFRFLGTLIGGIAAVVLVPNLSEAPVLLAGAMSLWTAICLFFALLDRTPRSYVFMLAGYTAAIIGFPAVDAPLDIFPTVVARVEEISLGIICSTIIGTIILPRPVAPVLIARLDSWFAVGRDWTCAVLAGRRDAIAARTARRAMAGASVEVGMLVTHLAYDTSLLQVATRPMSVLQRRMMFLLPVISGIGDRLAELRAGGAVSFETQTLLDRVAAWLGSGGDASEQQTARLQDAIARATPPVAADSDWRVLIRASLMGRLAELVEIVQDVQALRRQVMLGNPTLPPLALPRGLAPDATRYRDYGMALLSAFAAGVAVSLVCAFWIVTAWPSGATAAMMAAILCTFFAAQDDPVPAILGFLRGTAIAIVIDTVYLFAILPKVNGFEMLALALAPSYLILGVLIAMPATFLMGLVVAVNGASMLALNDTYNAHFADFANTSLAALAGMGAAATVTALIRSVGASWSARRLQRAGWLDIARAASRQGSIERPALAALMLDQLADLTTRLAASDVHADMQVQRALRDLRIGLNVMDLELGSPDLPPQGQLRLQAMLDGIEEYYRSRVPRPPDAGLRKRIDDAIAAVASAPAGSLAPMLMHVVGIRHGLFPDAPSYDARVSVTLETSE
jgi:uncharacterized membrane protein YccC